MMRDGLIAALVRENIPVTFIEDPALLTAPVLAGCPLLIIARHSRYRPDGYEKPQTAWMTGDQGYLRTVRKKSRTSPTNSLGCSKHAKCPPFGICV